MKAVVYTQYGSPDVLRLAEVPIPEPRDNEVRVRVYATPIGYGDLTMRNFANLTAGRFNMPAAFYFPARIAVGWKRPKINILGGELAGEIEAIGKAVTKFKPGDQVYAYVGMKMGANAEYICLPESGTIGLKPANMSYEQASTLPYGAIMASSLLRKVQIQSGQKVLINGASGGIGSVAVQLAKHLGAEVTGVCGTPRLEYVKSLGADAVIDYTKEDFTQNSKTYDLIFDILGRCVFQRTKHSLKPNGTLLFASFKMKQLKEMLWTSITGGRRVICAMASEKAEDLIITKELVEGGKLKTIIDRCYPLEQTAEAHRYLESAQQKGHVVLVVKSGGE